MKLSKPVYDVVVKSPTFAIAAIMSEVANCQTTDDAMDVLQLTKDKQGLIDALIAITDSVQNDPARLIRFLRTITLISRLPMPGTVDVPSYQYDDEVTESILAEINNFMAQKLPDNEARSWFATKDEFYILVFVTTMVRTLIDTLNERAESIMNMSDIDDTDFDGVFSGIKDRQ
jgi:hypothetical protein